MDESAYRELMLKKIDEILTKDEAHKRLNSALISLDKQIQSKVSAEIYKLFLEYEFLSIQAENNIIQKVINEISRAFL